MIDEENIIDLTDFSDCDVKNENIKSKNEGALLEEALNAVLKKNLEKMLVPIEENCDAIESKLNSIQESLNQIKAKQDAREKLIIINTIFLGCVFLGCFLYYLGR